MLTQVCVCVCVCVFVCVCVCTHMCIRCMVLVQRWGDWADTVKPPPPLGSLCGSVVLWFCLRGSLFSEPPALCSVPIMTSGTTNGRGEQGIGAARRGAAAVALAGCVFPPCLRTHATCREADALGGPDSVRPTESVTATMERQHTQITTVRSVQALMGQGGGGGRESGCLSRNPLWPSLQGLIQEKSPEDEQQHGRQGGAGG